MADPCPRCRRPLDECQAEAWGDAKAILECRETELSLVRAQLAAAVVVARCGIDMRTRLRKVDGSGSATIYFSAALSDLNKLLPATERVLVGQEQHELEAARRG